MSSSVAAAEGKARVRAAAAIGCAVILVGTQSIAGPFFVAGAASAHRSKLIVWAIAVIVLLLLLATGGALFSPARVRALLNDEVSRAHTLAATRTGFWVAMVLGLGLFLVPGFDRMSAGAAVYLVVTASTAAAMLTFGILESRALRGD